MILFVHQAIYSSQLMTNKKNSIIDFGCSLQFFFNYPTFMSLSSPYVLKVDFLFRSYFFKKKIVHNFLLLISIYTSLFGILHLFKSVSKQSGCFFLNLIEFTLSYYLIGITLLKGCYLVIVCYFFSFFFFDLQFYQKVL